ncbi:MAG: hypothetical protein WC028_02960 [Candidatus Obscuribacterales bacterium]
MKRRATTENSTSRRRSRNGFTLVSIMAVGFFAIAMMMSLFPLILQSSNSETGLRNATELRNVAEIAIDYGVVLLNQGIANNQVTPLDLAVNEYQKDYKPLDPLFDDYPGTSVSLRIKKLQPGDWTEVRNFSSVYSPLLNPSETGNLVSKDNWRVLEATATRGSLTRSIRVILEPRYDVPPSKPNPPPSNPGAYFADSFLASTKLTRATPDDVAQLKIQAADGTSQAELKTSLTGDDNQSTNTQLVNTVVTTSSSIKIAPVPADLTASNLSLSELATTGQNLTGGSYKTANLSTSTISQPVQVDTSASPVKIYVQDGNLPGNSIEVSTGMLPQSSTNAGDFQLFYEGTRALNIDLTSPSFYATIYAPNAQINLTGEGTMQGALVGSVITLSNSGTLKIDTDLSNPSAGGSAQQYGLTYNRLTGSTEPALQGYRTVSWKETTKRLAPLIN